jgi:tetratricopeptide (TPR) repeat protein
MGYPRNELIIVEYAAESVRPGIYRKHSVFRVGDRYIPHVGVHDTNWVIKEGRSGAAPDDLYEEELQTMRTNPFAETMKPIFEIAEIQFGRVDFSFVGGRLCVYEINTNPTIAAPSAHPSAKRTESMQIWWESLLKALHEIDAPTSRETQIDVTADDVVTIREALSVYPAMKRGALCLSEALSRRGEREEAIASAKAALAQAPDDPITMRRASSVFAASDLGDEAIEVARQALERDPQNLELMLHFATILARGGRRSEALGMVRGALRERPLDARCHRTLSLVHELLGDSGSAAKAITALQKLVSNGKISGGARLIRKLRAERWRLLKQAIREHLRGALHVPLRK